ncbi:Tubulin binding cofactor A [Ophiocordyceps camponoti-floridani]|uniref:Tubulin-specific chaperone A n=1 Tax=Ophiocordyceps camponoti-floridani TaxID=2030778 RepID=A0A8H4VGA7_9HYPO|nr:Tubulin binding cofactor A [Ophiocordyceps camponoti-floridani]
MPPPSPLAITTSSVHRLLKEEASYHTELAEQRARVDALEAKAGNEDEDGNAAFLVKQQRTVVEQTRAVFVPLRLRIDEAVAKLEEQVAAAEVQDGDLVAARAALEMAAKAKEERT